MSYLQGKFSTEGKMLKMIWLYFLETIVLIGEIIVNKMNGFS